MIDHYYGAYGDIARRGTERLNTSAEQVYGRRLEGEEHAAMVKQLRETIKQGNSATVTLAPPQPPPPPRPTEQIFEPMPGVMVREDIPTIEANPDLELRRTMVEARVNDEPGEPPGGLHDLLELGAKRDISLSENLALLGAYDGDVQNLMLRSRVEMGDVHGMQLLGDFVYNNPLKPSRYHHTPEMNFSLQTVDGGTIDIQLSIEEFINESGSYSSNMGIHKGMSRTLTFTMDSQGPVSKAAWEGLAPIMEDLDAMINTFNTDQALRQSDVDAFASQMAEQQDLFTSSRLNLSMDYYGTYRHIDISSNQEGTSVSTAENNMDRFYSTGVSTGAATMLRVDGEYDREAYRQLSPDNPKAFYLSAVEADWDTDYANLFRFMHSFLEE